MATNLFRRTSRIAMVSKKSPGGPLRLEHLEDRLAPAAFNVTTNQDNGDNINPLAGSLRAAINAVDNGLNDGITFGTSVAGHRKSPS